MDQYRKERIERLLKELQYEVSTGMMLGEIDEHLGFKFSIPHSKKIKDGIVLCEFRTRPAHKHQVFMDDYEPRLKVVK